MSERGSQNSKYTVTATIICMLLCVSVFFAGWFSGKHYTLKHIKENTVETIVYVKGDTIRDTVYYPQPYREFVHDSVEVYIYNTDTSELHSICVDYLTQRDYSFDFGNDTIGEFRVDASVAENKITSVASTIVPTVKKVTNTVYLPAEQKKKRLVMCYAMLGTSVNIKANQIQLGVEIADRYMVGLSGIRITNNYNYTINFGVKF